MKRILYILSAALLMVSCCRQNNKSLPDTSQMSDAHTAVCAPVEGQWLLVHVAVNDTPKQIKCESNDGKSSL